MRSEIQLHVRKYLTEDEKEEDFWKLIKRHKGEKTLVYLYRKKGDRGVDGGVLCTGECAPILQIVAGERGASGQMDGGRAVRPACESCLGGLAGEIHGDGSLAERYGTGNGVVSGAGEGIGYVAP